MRFMVIGMATRETEAALPPTAEQYAAMQKYNETRKAGISSRPRSPDVKGCARPVQRRKRTVIDGQFTETKELIAGCTIIR